MTKFAQKERPPQSCSKNCSTVNRHKKLLPSRSLDHSSEKQDLHSKAENALGSSGRLNDSHASSLSDAHFGHNFSQVRVHSSRRTMPTASPLAIGPIQAKLAVSQPGDEYEREADRVAERIIHQTYGTQSQCQTGQCPEFSGKKGEKHQMESTPQRLSVSSFQKSGTINTLSIPSNLEAAIHRARENGGILSDQARRPMERAFGANFAHVKIHTDDESNRLNQMLHARAFTLGQDIFFQRPYNPTSKQGQGLLAHELTHVTQQSKSSFSGQIIQLTPADFIDALYDNLNERIIRDRLINIIRSLESRNLQEARILYARLMTQGGALASRFERRLPTSHEDVLQVLGQRILELEREQREEYAARQTFQYSPRPDEGNASLSPELAQQIERIQQQSRGFQRVASTAPPGGRRESVRAYLQSPTRPAETVEHEEPEEGRQERVAAQQAAERVPESGRPSGQREARVELRSERSEPEEGRQEREVAQQAAVQAAERVPESERPSGQREARVERRNERSDPPQPIIPQSAQESARREERNERGEIIWEDVPDLVGRRLGTGLLAIAIIGLAVGAGIISGGTALIFAADLAAVSWMNSYFERREEIERGGYNVPIPNTAVTAFGDAIGLSQFIQGITGLELGTGRRLSGTERTSNVSTGSADLMLQAGLLIGSRAFRTGRATGQSSAGAPGSGRHRAAIERWQGRFGQAQTEMEMQSVRQRGREHWQQRRRSAGQREIGGTRERPGREGLSPPSTTSVSANAEAQAAIELSEGGAVQGINRPALSTTAGVTSRPPPRSGGSRRGGSRQSSRNLQDIEERIAALENNLSELTRERDSLLSQRLFNTPQENQVSRQIGNLNQELRDAREQRLRILWEETEPPAPHIQQLSPEVERLVLSDNITIDDAYTIWQDTLNRNQILRDMHAAAELDPGAQLFRDEMQRFFTIFSETYGMRFNRRPRADLNVSFVEDTLDLPPNGQFNLHGLLAELYHDTCFFIFGARSGPHIDNWMPARGHDNTLVRFMDDLFSAAHPNISNYRAIPRQRQGGDIFQIDH